MPLHVACPGCKTPYQVPDNLLGKKVQCKKCGRPIAIQRPAAAGQPRPAAVQAPAAAGRNRLLLFGGIGVLLLLLLGGWMVSRLFRSKSGPVAQAGGSSEAGLFKQEATEPAAPPPPASQVPVTKELYEKILLGMSLAQLQSFLGPATPIKASQVPGDPVFSDRDEVRKAGVKCKVHSWYRWGTDDLGIFAGLSVFEEGPERTTVAAFRFVERTPAGTWIRYPFKSEPNIDVPKLRFEPAQPVGNPRELLVGKWQQNGTVKLEFFPDGTLMRYSVLPEKLEERGVYEFKGDTLTIEAKPGAKIDLEFKGRAVFYTPDEMALIKQGEVTATPVLYSRVVAEAAGVRTLPKPPIAVSSLALTGDGRTVVIGMGAPFGGPGDVKLHDTTNGQERPFLKGPLPVPVRSVAVTADGKSVFAGMHDGEVIAWDASGAEKNRYPVQKGGRVERLALTPDGKTLAASAGPVVKVFDTASGTERGQYRRFTDLVTALALTPDGKVLAGGDINGVVKAWEVATAKELFLPRKLASAAHAVALAPDGKTLTAAGEASGLVRRFEIPSGNPGGFFRASVPVLGMVTWMTFTGNGLGLVTLSAGNQVDVWEMGAKEPRAAFQWYDRTVLAIAASPDGKKVVMAGVVGPLMNDTGEVRVWDTGGK